MKAITKRCMCVYIYSYSTGLDILKNSVISCSCNVIQFPEYPASSLVAVQTALLQLPFADINNLLVYHKTDILGLQNFLRDKFARWAKNSSCVEEIWKHFKEIVFESIKRFLPHNILGDKKNPNPESYNREVKWLKVNVRKAYNRRELG
jgi:hypothetical protein